MGSLGSVNRSTLREQVLDQLRHSILSGALTPGTKLAEVDLAAQLGVSRGTVREALRSLQESGLVEGEERTSLRVRELSGREIVELFHVRAALEGQAALEIMRDPRAAEMIDQLEELLPVVSSSMPVVERFETDLAFHEAMCRMGGNSILLTLWSSVKDLMRMTILADTGQVSEQLMSKAHHQPIVDALRSGDPDRTLHVIRDHMERAALQWAGLAAR